MLDVPMGDTPTGIAFDSVGMFAYVANQGDNV